MRDEYSENYQTNKSEIGLGSKDTIRNIKELGMRIRQTPLRARQIGTKTVLTAQKSKEDVEESKDVY